MSNRTPLVAGNWKMHLDRGAAVELALAVGAHGGGGVERAIFPAFVHLDAVCSALRGAGIDLAVGGQDLWTEPEGAFTGEVSAAMLADVGCRMVLAGHSERRNVLGESDELVGRKTAAALAAGLTCVLCVGETRAQREAGETDAVNERQIRAGLADVGASDVDRLVIAYEPVWAIGTGRTASPEDAQSAHAAIRRVLGELLDAPAALTTRILYGGSVKPANAADLFAQEDVDGGLVGGASLRADDFAAIVDAA